MVYQIFAIFGKRLILAEFDALVAKENIGGVERRQTVDKLGVVLGGKAFASGVHSELRQPHVRAHHAYVPE